MFQQCLSFKLACPQLVCRCRRGRQISGIVSMWSANMSRSNLQTRNWSREAKLKNENTCTYSSGDRRFIPSPEIYLYGREFIVPVQNLECAMEAKALPQRKCGPSGFDRLSLHTRHDCSRLYLLHR